MSDVRAPFDGALHRAFDRVDGPLFLLYTPAYSSRQTETPASVLAITAHGWLLAEEPSPGELVLTASDFAHTLCVELVDILLYGRIEIVYFDNFNTKHVYITFNTVTIRYYLDAINLILSGMRDPVGVADPPATQQAVSDTAALPPKFRSALRDFTPKGEHVRSLLSWPMAAKHRRFWFPQQLAPAGMLVLTEATLFIVQERLERSRRGADYGRAAIFTPLHRVRRTTVRTAPASDLARIALHLRAYAEAEDTLLIDVPSAYADAAGAIVKQLAGMRESHERRAIS